MGKYSVEDWLKERLADIQVATLSVAVLRWAMLSEKSRAENEMKRWVSSA